MAPRTPAPYLALTPHDLAIVCRNGHAVLELALRTTCCQHASSRQHSSRLPLTPSSCTLPQIGFTEQDLDEVKGLFSDMSLKVLGLTYCISMLHMLFDFLAFKNDVSSGALRERRESCAAGCSAGMLALAGSTRHPARLTRTRQVVCRPPLCRR